MKTVEEVLHLYREKYFDFNVQHLHEKLRELHGIHLSYTWVKTALQTAGLVERRKEPGSHRKRRPRRPMPGMMLHIDGSEHRWFGDERYYELIVVLDDATSEIYYAQLVEAESTRTVMVALREVVEVRGLFCSLYSDHAGHFLRETQARRTRRCEPSHAGGEGFTRAGIEMIAAYSRKHGADRSASFGTWQGRLPQELRLREIKHVAQADEFLRNEYIPEFNSRFAVDATQKGSAFVSARRKDLDWIFSVQHERTVNNDNTLALENRVFQLDKTGWRKRWLAKRSSCMSISMGACPSVTAQMSWHTMRLMTCRRKRTNGAAQHGRPPDGRPDPIGKQTLLHMEALPPKLRDLSL